MDRAFGSELVSSSPGTAICRLTAPDEEVGFGWLGALIDLACSKSYTTTLPTHQSCVTVDIRLDSTSRRLRPGETIYAIAELSSSDDRFGLARCRVQSEDTQLLGFGIARFAATNSRLGTGGRAPARRLKSKADLVDALGLQISRWAETDASYVLAPDSILENPNRVIHGGVQVALIEAAIADWLARRDAGRQPTTLDLSLAYLLPIPSPAKQLALELEARRIGSRLAAVHGVIRSDAGITTSFESTVSFENSVKVE